MGEWNSDFIIENEFQSIFQYFYKKVDIITLACLIIMQ